MRGMARGPECGETTGPRTGRKGEEMPHRDWRAGGQELREAHGKGGSQLVVSAGEMFQKPDTVSGPIRLFNTLIQKCQDSCGALGRER